MSLETLIQTVGLPGIVLGTAAEGEGVAFLSGVLAHRGLFRFEAVVLAATLGAVIIDNTLFLVGRFAGRSGLVQRVLGHRAVDPLRAQFHRRPALAVLGFRFIYGLKTAGAALAGTTGMTWVRFAALDAVAVLLWAHVCCGAGYLAGNAIEAALGRLKLHHHLLLSLGIGALLLVLLWRIAVRVRNKPS